jgi:hypothetical protein
MKAEDRSFSRKNKNSGSFFCLNFAVLSAAICLSSCHVSPSPEVQEIFKTEQPTFMGSYTINLNVTSVLYTLTGTCDKKSKATEYSVNDGVTWVDLGPCTTGNFSINLLVFTTLKVLLRSRTAFAYTNVSIANLTNSSPATNAVYSLVTASRSQSTSTTQPSLSFTMPSFMTGARPSGTTTFNIDHHPVGITYGQ